jgi:hypothetical protein
MLRFQADTGPEIVDPGPGASQSAEMLLMIRFSSYKLHISEKDDRLVVFVQKLDASVYSGSSQVRRKGYQLHLS